MSDQTVHLADYRPPAFLIDDVHLTFRLAPDSTRVSSRIAFRPNPDAPGPFHLDGRDLKLIDARINGAPVSPTLTDSGLTCDVPDGPFTWEAEVDIAPARNTALEGLYMSGGLYCTQCEAEGFRRITYFPDRPDVMARYTVRIESDAPVRLSNGALTATGEGWSEWHDPWPKPSYLFALVAGELFATRDSFTTRDGDSIDLAIWVRDGDQDKTAWAMESLKASMLWDERTYGRVYDLPVFNIVAVDDFNGGAMENKGLNLFNTALVLASADTATDDGFERIESVIAHEYFHNWTGNRVTCRDWFQLCLKEGLTVFRDQQFTADMRSAAVKRIDDAQVLRAHQFKEDAGPLAHPVRPDQYVEIDNFYTATVYEKGAEVIGMLKRLVGDEAYARAVDLYFTRHDGQACTVEDWLTVFEDATGRDLTQFKLWYTQSGTPHVAVTERRNGKSYCLTFSQSLPPTPGQPEKAPMVIPLAVALLDQFGHPICDEQLVVLTEPEQTISFDIPPSREPVASINRGFSAPVILDVSAMPDLRAHLLAHDDDPFSRWDAGRSLARSTLTAMIVDGAGPDAAYVDGLGLLIANENLDPAFRALCLALPSADDMARALHDGGVTPDPIAIRAAREALSGALANTHGRALELLFETHQVPGPYSPAAEPAGKRALTNAALALLTRLDGGSRARNQLRAADNLTQSLGALSALLRVGLGAQETAAFGAHWSHERLVMDRWFSLQVISAAPEEAVATVERLKKHPAYDARNPNRFRAVVMALAGNAAGFHHPSGAGYALMADELIAMDSVNPKVAARASTAFQTMGLYDADRQEMMRDALLRVAATPTLSRDLKEMVDRIVAMP